MRLHQRGVDLMVDLLDAAEHVDELTNEETRALQRECAKVLGDLLARDVPAERNEISEPTA